MCRPEEEEDNFFLVKFVTKIDGNKHETMKLYAKIYITKSFNVSFLNYSLTQAKTV